MNDTPTNIPKSQSAHELSANEERNWAAIAHLSSLINLIGVPSPLGPLIVWLFKKNDSDFIASEAKESLNFALSVWIYGAIFLILGFLGFVGSIETGLVLSVVLLIAWGVLILGSMVFSIIGGIKASNGEDYSYPFVIKLVK